MPAATTRRRPRRLPRRRDGAPPPTISARSVCLASGSSSHHGACPAPIPWLASTARPGALSGDADTALPWTTGHGTPEHPGPIHAERAMAVSASRWVGPVDIRLGGNLGKIIAQNFISRAGLAAYCIAAPPVPPMVRRLICSMTVLLAVILPL